ncbi:MAG TPA: V-type ATP synthase subunit F [Candidatus Margulisiibacteriota bacterium]|nr:V-type ATP synthase subunit F [Candidatus Margulisiibacteriota bacterium]
MNPVQVIGDADTVLAFALGGVPGHVVSSTDDARAAVDAVVNAVRRAGGPVREPTLLLVTSAIAERIRAHLDAVMLDANAPLILEFTGFSDPPSDSRVARLVGRVLGVRL